MKPKVCIQTRHFGARGGLEKWSRRLAQGFAHKGMEVHLLSVDSPSLPLIQSHSLPCNQFLSYQRMKAFDLACQKWQQSHPTDLVFGMDRTTKQTHIRAGNGVHTIYLQQRKRYEGYTSFQALLNPLNQTILKIEKEAFENPELKVLFTNSYMVKREVLSSYALSEDQIEVVHNGLEWKEMEKDFETWVERKKGILESWSLDPTQFHFLFVGNGYQRKGLHFLLRGLAQLNRKDVHLSVIGKDRKEQDFKKIASRLGIESQVTFLGSQKEVRPFYQCADALVIPSIYDPFANVTVEALGMGLFVVSSKHNGGQEVLKDTNGCVIEELLSPDSMEEALKRALLHPKTWVRSQEIRNSVQHLDFSSQLDSIIGTSLRSL